jgi:C-terminal processing protease CtpA/Prc
VRVDLVPRAPKFRESKFRDLFKDDKGEAGKGAAGAKGGKDGGKSAIPAVQVQAEGLRTRVTLLPTAVDVQRVLPSPDGKQLLLVAAAEGAENLYLWSLDELATDPPVAKQLTSTRGGKSNPQFSADGKTVYYLEDGAVMSVATDSREAKPVSVTAEMDVDFDVEKGVVFDQAWQWQREHFHDEKMNGADWSAVRETFAPRVAGARTTVELCRLLSMMVGELNASHSGVNPPGDPVRVTGRLGLRFDRAEYERSGALRVSGVVPRSPADVTRQVAAGDVLTAVDGVALGPDTALEELLENKVGKEVRLTFAGKPGGPSREIAVQPVTQTVEKTLIYREWVEKNRAMVAKLSGGKLGYVHMPDMGFASLQQLIADLDAENMTRDGVVVDIRNNNGGFVNPYALDILSRRHYLNMADRGWPVVNARTSLGQRSLEKPTVLITNQHSLSDAEDMSEGYRSLGLGPIVGEPSSGWIIYTSNERMIDGSVIRIPIVTITTAKGEPMEMHPRPVDIEVRRALGEDSAGRDSQLERAVGELAKRVAR